VGDSFLTVAGAGYWSGVSEATLNGSWLWPNLIAVALSASPLVVLLIGIGYILNSFQIVNNCYIGMTRVMVAMSLDRVLPEWVSRVNERFHTPVNAHVLYFVASIPVILLYNLYGSWAALTLGVTFACGYVFVITCLAGALLPYRAKDLYEASPGSKYTLGGIPWVTILGLVGFVTGGLMVLLFIFNEQLGLTTDLARIVVIAVLVVSAAWYLIVKAVQRTRGINVEYAFKEIPPE
jgi:amino acid transporter